MIPVIRRIMCEPSIPLRLPRARGTLAPSLSAESRPVNGWSVIESSGLDRRSGRALSGCVVAFEAVRPA